MIDQKRYKVIACEILARELWYAAARSRNIVDIEFMEKKLHDVGSKEMSKNLQEEIDRVDINRYDAILLVYGLCNNGITGLRSELPIIVPRAHDCITLLMGSKEKYMKYHEENIGTYYKSPGWIERDQENGVIASQLGTSKTYLEYVEKYGEENAKFLMETLGDWTSNYDKYAYIDTDIDGADIYIEETKRLAAEKGWGYETIQGNTLILQKMLDGDWDKDIFQIIPKGNSIKASYDDKIIGV